MNYLFATIVSGALWLLWGMYVIGTRVVSGPPVVGAAFAWLVAPIFLGIIPYALAGALLRRWGWSRFAHLPLVAALFLILWLGVCLVAPAQVTGIHNAVDLLGATCMLWLFSLTFGLPLTGRVLVHEMNASNRLPRNRVMRLLFREWWTDNSSNKVLERNAAQRAKS